MTSAGRRGGRQEAADAPTGWCGGLGFAPSDAAAWGEQRPGPSGRNCSRSCKRAADVEAAECALTSLHRVSAIGISLKKPGDR
ncbi:hypothetical protein NDU88_008792 [Pleurodeles waltl]|uniref:Uncharacterized protein n=1 Tax=Pleurodeles waltl TaxID=8319 RepID=A0AAV7RWI0_PLEWA|nr:hypothetical protein NDU88_008792 [Pleurodeles waltl]